MSHVGRMFLSGQALQTHGSKLGLRRSELHRHETLSYARGLDGAQTGPMSGDWW